jgi:hypothetical protein
VCRAALFDADNAQAWRETATAILGDEELSKDRRQLCSALARELREEYELFCCSHSGLAFDLLELAVTKVDWLEVAEELLLNQNKPQPELLG